MVNTLFKIKTEIQVLDYVLNKGSCNLLPSQKKYLRSKLEDLIHSCLLEEKRMGLINVEHNKNLYNGDFSLKSNRGLIENL